MKISVINIANKMPDWVSRGCNEYLKRINHGKYSCQLIELKADKNPKRTVLETKAAEAKKFSAAIAAESFIIALDEHGKNYTSPELAQFLQHTALYRKQISFIIGGAAGLCPELLARADARISLSALVFPHALVRIMILEQIYRAIAILENHPYHRE